MATNDPVSTEDQSAEEQLGPTQAAHPVIRAAEEKLAAVEAGEYMDVERHQAIRAKHLGETALTPEQRATGALGSENTEEANE